MNVMVDPAKIFRAGSIPKKLAGIVVPNRYTTIPEFYAVDDYSSINFTAIGKLSKELKEVLDLLPARKAIRKLKGKPLTLRVWRGESAEPLDIHSGEYHSDYGWYGRGSYHTQSKSTAKGYEKGTLRERYLRFNNPKLVTLDEAARLGEVHHRGVSRADSAVLAHDTNERMIRRGYDGLVRVEEIPKPAYPPVAHLPCHKNLFGAEIVSYVPEEQSVIAQLNGTRLGKPVYDNYGYVGHLTQPNWQRKNIPGLNNRPLSRKKLVDSLVEQEIANVGRNAMYTGHTPLIDDVPPISAYDLETLEFPVRSAIERTGVVIDKTKAQAGLLPIIDTGKKVTSIKYVDPKSPEFRELLRKRISNPRRKPKVSVDRMLADVENKAFVPRGKTVGQYLRIHGYFNDTSPIREDMYLGGSVGHWKLPMGPVNDLAIVDDAGKKIDVIGGLTGKKLALARTMENVLDRREAAQKAWKTRKLRYGPDGIK